MPIKRIASGLLLIAVCALSVNCGGRIDIELQASGAAKVGMQTKLEDGVVRGMLERIASFTGNEPLSSDDPLFDVDALKDSMKGRKDVIVDSAESPDPDSIKAAFTVPDILKAGASGNGFSPFFSLKSSNGQKTLSFRLDRENAALLPEIIPVLDAGIFEMLSPPSLYGDEISAQEYRDSSLALFVGAKNLPAIDKSAAEIRIVPPGKITAQTGGRIEGGTFVASLPLMTALMLEKPYEFSLTWKE